MSAYDVAIIGAGAAGIGAARHLAERGRTIIVLEARERVGGRAHTVRVAGGDPVDLGCEWLHSADRNPLTAIARARGFTVDERLPDWGGRLIRTGASAAEYADWQAARDAFYTRLKTAAGEVGDRAAGTLLEPGGRWNPLLQAVSTWANGVELDRLSVADHARYTDSGINWRLREGYGSLFAALAEGLPIALANPVRHVDHRGRRIAVETARGTVDAAAVLVTLPPTLLAEGAVRFTPPLPAAKRAAAEGLPLGLADKLFLALDGPAPDLPADSHVLGSTTRIATGSYQLRPHGRPMIAAYFGGTLARELEAAGAEAMAQFARDELAGLFGNAFAKRLRRLSSSAWFGDPWARGSYSFALPGHAGDRAVLGAAIDRRLFFAGEACAPHFFSTAHGAFESGIAAAQAIIETI
ncbi:MAG: FAD-dependent oxidoreductase [Alphaproteobacteria bacterium]|nr:FAD-dependent oxidoreductase [Alphaproteobacteria bacterium]